METVSLRRPAKKSTVNQPRSPSDRCVISIQAVLCSESDAAGGRANPGYAVLGAECFSFLHPSIRPSNQGCGIPLFSRGSGDPALLMQYSRV